MADEMMKADTKNTALMSEQMFYGKQLSRYPKRKEVIPQEEIDKAIER